MVRIEFGRLVAGIGVLMMSASAAGAQDNVIIGNPQLRDFSLPAQERIVTQPTPAPQTPPVRVAPPSPVNTTPQETPPRVAPPPAATRPAPAQAAPPRQQAPVQPAPAPSAPTLQTPPAATAPPPVQTEPAPSAPPVSIPADGQPEADGEAGFPWLYLLPVALLALFGFAALRRRRRAEAEMDYEVAEAPLPAPAAPPPPRADPIERPWLELELKAERASFTATEANLNFQLEIRNSGKTPAKNLRIDVKLFNAGAEQDKEIGTFFRTAGREATRLNLPGVPPGTSGVIQGEVGMPLEQMRAVQLDGRALFIPVIAVNALYDCGDGRTGQSSKSYIVGRELQEASEKMGAFRVDQGPRIWRTVGQRPHKLARRI